MRLSDMAIQSLRPKWANGETTIGAWLTYREPLLA